MAASHPAAHQRDGLFCGDVRRAAHSHDALLEIITVDAGMTSKAHAAYVQAADKGYVMAVRTYQPSCCGSFSARADATRRKRPSTQRLGAAQGTPRASTVPGTVELAGLPGLGVAAPGGWCTGASRRRRHRKTARGPLLHQQRTPLGLSPSAFWVSRGHWGSERRNWTLDPRDDTPMCAKAGDVDAGVPRLLAYNLLQLACRKHLRPQAPAWQKRPAAVWREVPRLRAALTRS